jgi:hypothetical protein
MVFRQTNQIGEFLMYAFKSYPVDQDPTIKGLRGEDMENYMNLLKWLDTVPFIPLKVSDIVLPWRDR